MVDFWPKRHELFCSSKIIATAIKLYFFIMKKRFNYYLNPFESKLRKSTIVPNKKSKYFWRKCGI
jgi:hypothetical protein